MTYQLEGACRLLGCFRFFSGLFPSVSRPVSCIQADADLRVMPSLSEPVRAEPADRAEARHRAHRAPQLERAWDAWQAERYQRGEISQRPGYADSPFRPRQRPPVPQRAPGPFRKLDAIAVLTGPLSGSSISGLETNATVGRAAP
jgi:hypothetical protein